MNPAFCFKVYVLGFFIPESPRRLVRFTMPIIVNHSGGYLAYKYFLNAHVGPLQQFDRERIALFGADFDSTWLFHLGAAAKEEIRCTLNLGLSGSAHVS